MTTAVESPALPLEPETEALVAPLGGLVTIGVPDPKSNALLSIRQASIETVFTDPEALAPVLSYVADLARAHQPDLTTKKGREAIASVAYKVAQTKTYMDGLGKVLVDELKERPKKVDAGRKQAREFFDSLRDEVRKPLTDLEAEEARQVAAVEAIRARPAALADATAEQIQAVLTELEATTIDITWHNAEDGQMALLEARVAIREALAKRQQYDADQAELARLRKEEAERKAEEERERLRKEGEERARKALVAQAKRDHILDLIATSTTRREAMAKAADGFVDRTTGEVLTILEDILTLPAFMALPMETTAPAPDPKPMPQGEGPGGPCDPPSWVRAAFPEDFPKPSTPGPSSPAEDPSVEHRRTFNREALDEIKRAIYGTFPSLDHEAVAKVILTAIVAGRVPHVSITY